MAEPVELRQAATLILARDGAEGLEVLMVVRNSGLAFAAGALVFPGGRVDDADLVLEEDAHRVAALRELYEEVGLLLASPPATALSESLRRAVEAEPARFLPLLAEHGLSLQIDALIPFARWIPPLDTRRRYDTRFFVARAPTDQAPAPDGREAVAALWLKPAAALALADARVHRMLFPTRMNLLRLGQCASVDALEAHARAYPVEPITPWIERHDGRDWLTIPSGLGYGETRRLFNPDERDAR